MGSHISREEPRIKNLGIDIWRNDICSRMIVISHSETINFLTDMAITNQLGYLDSPEGRISHFEDSQEGLIKHLASMNERVLSNMVHFYDITTKYCGIALVDVEDAYGEILRGFAKAVQKQGDLAEVCFHGYQIIGGREVEIIRASGR